MLISKIIMDRVSSRIFFEIFSNISQGALFYAVSCCQDDDFGIFFYFFNVLII